jgi:ketosteroid isomerase-like protein
MSERAVAERLVKGLHEARVRGDLAAMCGLFSDRGTFTIAGASADKPIGIREETLTAFKPWLSMMVKVFRLSEYELLSLVIEWPKATAHWRVKINSKVTGITVATELVDLIEIRDGKIVSYAEFFVPC